MEIKDLLQKVKPIMRAKASVEQIDRKIDTYTEAIKSLKLQKKQILDENQEDDILAEVEAWADSLPNDIVPTSEIRQILKALEYLNK